jgi:aspartate/methionine/tyrosine aminotransferase
MTVADLLALEPGAEDRLGALWLGYTENAGSPELRRAIAGRHEVAGEDDVVVFTGSEEPVFTYLNVALRPGDHVVVHAPCYQSHAEVARSAGADVSAWTGDPRRGWALDPVELEKLMTPSTRVVILTTPHNPTGAHLSRSTFDEVVAIVRRQGAWLFSDEVYRGLEHFAGERLPRAVDVYERGVSLDGLSKSYGLAGLRLGWLALRDRTLRERILAFKDYLSMCNAAPSEALGAIAVRQTDLLQARSRARLASNLELLDAFFSRHPDWFEWTRPRAGSVAFARFLRGSAEAFCDRAVAEAGVMLVPSTKFDAGDSHIRFGYGRSNLAEALATLEGWMERR